MPPNQMVTTTEYKTWKTGSWAKLNAQAEQGYKHLIHGDKFQYFAEFSSPFVIHKVWRVTIDKVKKFCKDFMARTKKEKGILLSISVTNGLTIMVNLLN